MRGRNSGQFDLPTNGTVLGTILANTDDGVETPWTVFIQPVALPLTVDGTANVPITATVRFAVGDIELTKQVTITSTANQKVIVSGARVSVDLQVGAGAAQNPATVPVKVAATFGAVTGGDAYVWTESAVPSTAGDAGQAPQLLSANPCVVGRLKTTLAAVAAATPIYLLLIDKAVAPNAGAKPIPGGVRNLVTTGGTVVAGISDEFIDERIPGSIGCNTQLWAVLSTTPDSWTKPAAGYAARFDARLGQ